MASYGSELSKLAIALSSDPGAIRSDLTTEKAREIIGYCIREIDRNRDLLRALCGVSYQHPNGFAKLVLAHELPMWCLRLHYWVSPTTDASSDIHNHCGPLTSWLVAGELRDEIFGQSDEGPRYSLYQDIYDGTAHHLSKQGTVALRRLEVRHRSAGDLYMIDRSVIHRTTPGAVSPVVSIVAEGVREVRSSSLFIEVDRTKPTWIATGCEPDWFTANLRAVKTSVK